MWDLWVERFIRYRQARNFSKKTVRDGARYLRFFFSWLRLCGITKLSEVTGETLSRYQTWLYYYEKDEKDEKKGRKSERLSFDTQYRSLVTVRLFFNFLLRENYLPHNPSGVLELPRRKKTLPRGIMTPREVEKVLGTAGGDDVLQLRDRAILEVLYSTGIRNSELRSLNILDVNLPASELLVREGKGGRERIVPLGWCALRAVVRYLKESRQKLARDPSCNLLFVSVSGKQLTQGSLIWIVKKYVSRANLKKCVTPHSFRHSCASHMLRNRADLRHIQELLGHESVQSTQIYTKVELSDLKEVHKRCHPRERKDFTS